jgi:type I restriction-modification system DNA methylase subunit
LAANKKSKTVVSKKLANYTLDNPSKITCEFLKSHLWSAADILRGSLDASEYRQPVMTLLFLKRLNDTFEENSEKLIKKDNEKSEIFQKIEPYLTFLNIQQLKRQGADLETKIEELKDMNQVLREKDKIKEDVIASLSDKLIMLSERLDAIEKFNR